MIKAIIASESGISDRKSAAWPTKLLRPELSFVVTDVMPVTTIKNQAIANATLTIKDTKPVTEIEDMFLFTFICTNIS